MKIGEKYYLMAHAYHHVCGTVVELHGSRTVVLNNCVIVHSCERSWTEFFRDGFKDDTRYDVIPDGTEVSGQFIACPWPHAIPTSGGRRRGR